MVTLNVSAVITTRKPNSRVAVDGRAIGEREMLVALLRDFARRTAQEHRERLQSAHSQLRLINSIARETLVATRESAARTTVRTRRGDDVKPNGHRAAAALAERHDAIPEHYHQRQPPLLREREVFF
jgi:hypothetical protein